MGVGAEALIVDAASRLELQRIANRCVRRVRACD